MKFKKYLKSKTAWFITLIVTLLVSYQYGERIFEGFMYIALEKPLFGIFIFIISFLGGLFLERLLFKKRKLNFGFLRGRK